MGMNKATQTQSTGHRFQQINPKPYLRMKLSPPVTCAYCMKHAGDPAHNTKKG